MRVRIYSLPIIFLLGFLLFMVTRQFVANLYWKMACQNEKQLNRAIGYLERCIALDNKNSLFHFSMGRAFLRKGIAEAMRLDYRNKWVRESIHEFHKAIDLEPSDGDYHFHLGISYGCLTYPPPVYWNVIQKNFTRTVMLDPTNARHLYSIGVYYLDEHHRASNIDQAAKEIRPVNNTNYLAKSKDNYQLCFRKLADVNEGYLNKILNSCFSVTRKYTDLKAVIGDTASSHALLARFLNSKGMWKEAKKEYMMAINLEPFNPIHYSNFAIALSIRKDFDNAIIWWQKQKMLDCRDEKIYLSLTHTFMRLKRFDEAVRELRDLIKVTSGNIHYRVKLIRTLLAVGRLDEAIDEYYKVMERNQNLSKSMYDAMREYQLKGDYAKATKILDEALVSAIKR
jgi:tetratricopeptide (TPR) repeat protein